jgi:hypothetical protein
MYTNVHIVPDNQEQDPVIGRNKGHDDEKRNEIMEYSILLFK